ncbi:D-aminoacylase [Fulvivirgaceae bacterium BMA10]|uniref:D-aminoacylase n=1 Tax=Splendidivirga corallicola TaxID=3051826 RepID=A0ABT8KP78_9BACT|nr:D-aminoacylase [Fulvivirgaceae bacterium BMA10]
MLDIKFTGATIVDGSGSATYVADIGIVGDKIARIGNLSTLQARKIIDVKGKILCPGFIDVHTHDDNAILNMPDALPKISQGVTTAIVGNCGISSAPSKIEDIPPDPLNLLGKKEDFKFPTFKAYIDKINEIRPAVNIAALCGHLSLRNNAMTDLYRECTDQELDGMKRELALAMQQGAIGFSTGLAYGSSNSASTTEVIELAKVAAQYGGIYTTHLRNEFEEIIAALEESFTICDQADLPILVSHLKCAGIENWGRSEEVLNTISNAACYKRIHMDCYPYTAGSSTLDLKQVDEKVRILITWSDSHPDIAPKYLDEIALEWNMSQLESAKKLQPAGAVYFSMNEEDMQNILRHEKTMIGSDGLPHDPHPHPRLYGTFPRVLGKYVREHKLLTLSDAIRKMTSLPAKKFQFEKRGLIAEGFYADLIIFDWESINDTATFDQPKQLAEGIVHVLVNGKISYSKGSTTVERNGKYLTRSDQTIKQNKKI